MSTPVKNTKAGRLASPNMLDVNIYCWSNYASAYFWASTHTLLLKSLQISYIQACYSTYIEAPTILLADYLKALIHFPYLFTCIFHSFDCTLSLRVQIKA